MSHQFAAISSAIVIVCAVSATDAAKPNPNDVAHEVDRLLASETADADSQPATRANAEHNGVDIEVYADFDLVQAPVDIIIVADVLYDRDNLPWLETFIQRAGEVLVADSRVKNFSYPPYELIDQRRGVTVPDLDEFDEFRDVRIYYAKRD